MKYTRFLPIWEESSMNTNFIKRILLIIDNQFETFLYERAIKLKEAYYSSTFLNLIRRNINPLTVKLKYKFRVSKNLLKLHLGCGSKHLGGYVNIDWRKTKATDFVCDIKKLPYPNNSISRIESYHVIEHLPRHVLLRTLREWYRLLVLGGKLVVEYPSFDKIVKRYLNGDEKQLDGIFGLQRFEGDYHLFGYNFKRLRRILEKSGFINIEEKDAQDDHAKEWPCIRVECIKGEKDISSFFHKKNCNLTFIGERVIEGSTPERIWLDHVARYKFAGRYVKDKSVLDISCGTGYGSRILYDAGATKVAGVDISTKAIDFAYAKYKINELEFKVGDILNIDFPESCFDVITCFETIEHVKNQKKALSELKRVLKPKGLLIISSPNRRLTSPFSSFNEPPNNPFHVVEYTTKEFCQLIGRYFEILGLYGQRGILKVFLLLIVERMLRRIIVGLFNPEKGQSELEEISSAREYRYVTVVCKNSKHLIYENLYLKPKSIK